MKFLKSLGRFFLVLTEEEKDIASEDIRALLIVNLQEGHYEKVIDIARKRFKYAEIKTVYSNTVKGVIAKLHKLKEEQFSVVIVLSLNPFVIFFLILIFNCYFLIYNRFDKCFLIRRKTLYEFLAGRRGADKEKLDWKVSPARLNFARCAVAAFLLPLVFIKNVFRFVRLIIYSFFNLLQLIAARYYYKFINSRKIK